MVAAFSDVEARPFPEWFAACDPPGSKLGSGGGLVRLLRERWVADRSPEPFEQWLKSASRLAVLAGGQSRRLPAYAPCGKIFTPMPALRWSFGHKIDGTLLDFMLPGFERVMDASFGRYPLMVCSGDVVLKFPPRLPALPDADIVALGMWVAPETAAAFGVFFSRRETPHVVEFARQKPSAEEIRALGADHLCVVDTGVWLLSERAVNALLRLSGWESGRGDFPGGEPNFCELYAGLGLSLGTNPTVPDEAISSLSAAVVPLPDAEFYHLGTNRDLIASMSALQNSQLDQMVAGPLDRKPHPDIYVINADFPFATRSTANRQVWIENCRLPAGQPIGSEQILTGIPGIGTLPQLPDGICLDIVPVDEALWCARPYGFDDAFKGAAGDLATVWMGAPLESWFAKRGISLAEAGIDGNCDIQLVPLFPLVGAEELDGAFIEWMVASEPAKTPTRHRERFLADRLSAMELCERASVRRLYAQRHEMVASALPRMRANSRTNPFYRLDLASVARHYPVPIEEASAESSLIAVHDAMLRAAVCRRFGKDGTADEARAFGLLAETIVGSVRPYLSSPARATLDDQIVWGRSPVRLDLAGGWSDTPPYCFAMGGGVVNIAADINGQPPVQVFARICDEPHIILRSIDLGQQTQITTYDDLGRYAEPGSGFALARAALSLAGFHPRFQREARYPDLRTQLQEFGGGIEISLLAAAPKGSGLGTSSILAATLLGVLSDSCGLGWDSAAIVKLTLAIEQMLTTGGGWQDQAGALYRGIKYIETVPGLGQEVSLRWVPDHLFDKQHSLAAIRLYYTGVTRMASGILREIVRGIFLNSSEHLNVIADIRRNADATFDALQHGDLERLGRCVAGSWRLNCRLDAGTNPPPIHAIFSQVSDFLRGGKLLGAGGGGYALFLAKDEEAAARLQRKLEMDPPNASARFVDFTVSKVGLEITRS